MGLAERDVKHFGNALGRMREALADLEAAQTPTAIALFAHQVVHNGVVVLRDIQGGRGKIEHRDVAAAAEKLGLPKELAGWVGETEAWYPKTGYGTGPPPRERAEELRAAARRLAGLVEESVARLGGARRPLPARRRS